MFGLEMIQVAALMNVILGLIMALYIICSLLVILVVLAQEGKGGGLAGAFGGAGVETFGVKAGTVNKFTAWVGALFLGLALLHAGISSATAAKQPGKDKVDTKRFEGDSAPGEDEATKKGAAAPGDAKAQSPNKSDEKKAGDKKAGDEKAGDKKAGDKKAGDEKADDTPKKGEGK